MKQVTNLTPHVVNIVGGSSSVTIEPSGRVARVSMVTSTVGDIGGIPIVTSQPGEVEGLPSPKCGTYYLVSTLVRIALPGRPDLLSPMDLVRDFDGKITGCLALGKNP